MGQRGFPESPDRRPDAGSNMRVRETSGIEKNCCIAFYIGKQMKKLNLHNGIFAASAVLCSILLGACSADELVSRDENLHGDSDVICFGVMKVSGEVWPDTKSGGAAGDAQATRFVLRGENAGDSLCVKAEVCEFGESDGVATKGALAKAMHDNFGVTACFKSTGSTSSSGYLFFNEQNNKPASGTTWTYDSGRIYYWPGSSFNLDFYAYSPYSNAGLTTPVDNGDGAVPSISYVVPASVSSQADLLSAVSAGNSGSTNATVPLTFKHICTAVEFVEGDDMQPGSITSIKVKGVRNSGSYSFGQTYTDDASAWTLGSTTADFEALASSYTTSQTSGADISGDSNCLIMLPQVLPDGASVEIAFTDNVTGKSRTLTASLAGQTWPQGKRVRYRISISPDYDLSFDEENVRQVDAHYLIQTLKIHVDPALTTGWTLESPDADIVTLRSDLTDLEKQGYWIEEDRGTQTITGTNTGDISVYAFFAENIGEAARDVKFTLYPTGYKSVATTSTISQLCPAWNSDGIGCERIEDGDYTWGFNWSSDMKIVYSIPSSWDNFWRKIIFSLFGDKTYVKSSGTVIGGNWEITVDFSKVPALTTATSSSDGASNTWELYNFNGVSDAQDLMDEIESWGGVPDKTLPTNPAKFAARECVMKNKFQKELREEQGQSRYFPKIDQSAMVWYLPSQEESLGMKDNLSGDYWTSTAITSPGTTAYKYVAGGSTTSEDRNTSIHVRAVRKKL